MRTRIGFGAGLLAAAFVLLAAGCGKEKLTTPEACMKAFDAAMRKGDMAKASKLVALEKCAADSNPDWGSFPASQRELILGKLRESFGQKLEGVRQAYLQAGYQVAGVQTQGEWATLQLTGAGSALPVVLYSGGGEWRIYSLGTLQATVE